MHLPVCYACYSNGRHTGHPRLKRRMGGSRKWRELTGPLFYEITRLVAKMYGDNIRVAGRLPALFSRNQIALDSLVRKT